MNNVMEALFKWVMYHFFHQQLTAFETKHEQMLVGSYIVTPTVTCANFTECVKAAWAILQEEEVLSNIIFTLSNYII